MPPTTELKQRRIKTLVIAAHAKAQRAIDAKAALAELGPATGPMQPTPDGRGFQKPFGGATVYFRDDRGALEVHGAIAEKYASIGGVTGAYGWPTTDETAVPKGPGRFNHFDGGSIYWGPQTGARLVYGAIRDKWASLGWEQGVLGMPVSDEEDVPGVKGARRSRFEGGVIVWTPANGAHMSALTKVGQARSALGGEPAIMRHVIASVSMDITDDEDWGSNEHAHHERRSEKWVGSTDPQQVLFLTGDCGDEIRVDVSLTAACRPDGSINCAVDARLYEGTDPTTTDLDGARTWNEVVPAGGVVQVPLRVINDEEGGDFVDISLAISNSDT